MYTSAIFAGLYYGLGIHLLTDLSIFFMQDLKSTAGLFEQCRYMSYSSLAYMYVITFYPQWKSLFISRPNSFGWSLSFFAVLLMGFGYANAIVYPAEMVCTIYTSSLNHTLDRLLLAAPSGIILVCFAELLGWNLYLH
jgi:hypothetical protein